MCYAVRKYWEGQVWLINGVNNDCQYKKGVIEKTRPWLIYRVNSNGSAIVLPITTSENGSHKYDGAVKIREDNEFRWIICSQMKTVSSSDMFRYKYCVGPSIMELVKNELANVLNIEVKDRAVLPSNTETITAPVEPVTVEEPEPELEEVQYDDGKWFDNGKVRVEKDILYGMVNSFYHSSKVSTMKSFGKYFKQSWELMTEIAIDIVMNKNDKDIVNILNKSEIRIPKHTKHKTFSDEELKYIEARLNANVSQRQIAKELGTHQSTISNIKTRLAAI